MQTVVTAKRKAAVPRQKRKRDAPRQTPTANKKNTAKQTFLQKIRSWASKDPGFFAFCTRD
jgi:hypothetical protein